MYINVTNCYEEKIYITNLNIHGELGMTFRHVGLYLTRTCSLQANGTEICLKLLSMLIDRGTRLSELWGYLSSTMKYTNKIMC